MTDRKEEETLNRTTFELLGYGNIVEELREYAVTPKGREMAGELAPFLSEAKLRKHMRDTTQARQLLDALGAPPFPAMEHVEEYVEKAVKGELLLPEHMEQIGFFLVAVRRMQVYLEKGKDSEIGLAFYGDNLAEVRELQEEIARSVRGGRIDDYASNGLRDIRREIQTLEGKIKEKAESALRAGKAYVADSFVVNRSGRVCIPVKKEYKSKVPGMLVDKSSTGSTLFIEPQAVAKLRENLELCRIDEDTEERRILYTLMDRIAEHEAEILEDIRVVVLLDFIFAKAKLSARMGAIEPKLNTERYIRMKQARHPMLREEECVPLDFEIGRGIRGIVITGPNTGGKTVAMKTVGLLSLMACSGLHVPCEKADIAMNSQVLCDIGDGQNISDNLSTFSAHIRQVNEILGTVNEESLVLLDELGSGTDPAEGMGIAIAVLEELRKSGCLFLVTTHYPEVKEYGERHSEIVNARMAFDRESLRPQYRLEIGKSGDSCALYIAKRLGVPDEVLLMAAREAYREQADGLIRELELDTGNAVDTGDAGKGRKNAWKQKTPHIEKQVAVKREAVHGETFTRGDSVTVSPEQVIGIVVKPADRNGDVLVQIQKEKKLISHKRLKLKVAASELYPEDYDFSIIFDTVENRKARHQLGKGYQAGLEVPVEEALK